MRCQTKRAIPAQILMLFYRFLDTCLRLKNLCRWVVFASLALVGFSWTWSHGTPFEKVVPPEAVGSERAAVQEIDIDHPWRALGRDLRRTAASTVEAFSGIAHGRPAQQFLHKTLVTLDRTSEHLDELESAVPDTAYVRISDRFGPRYHPILKRWRMHNGVDYAAPRGTPVLAVADGTITHVGWSGGAGRLIKIEHDGFESGYSHLSRFARGLKAGDTVVQGQPIGGVGASGLATGHHLHFSIRVDGRFVDPHDVDLERIEPLKEAQFLVDFERGLTSTVARLNARALDALTAMTRQDSDQPDFDALWFDDSFL